MRDGYETVLIFNSRDENLTNDAAKENLVNFGASEIIVMDSGGATALKTDKSEYLSTNKFYLFERKLPQMIDVLSAYS